MTNMWHFWNLMKISNFQVSEYFDFRGIVLAHVNAQTRRNMFSIFDWSLLQWKMVETNKKTGILRHEKTIFEKIVGLPATCILLLANTVRFSWTIFVRRHSWSENGCAAILLWENWIELFIEIFGGNSVEKDELMTSFYHRKRSDGVRCSNAMCYEF